MTFSGFLCVLPGEIDIGRKMEKTGIKSCLCKLNGSLTKEKSPVMKRRVSLKMSFIQNTLSEIFDRLNFTELSGRKKSSCSEKLL